MKLKEAVEWHCVIDDQRRQLGIVFENASPLNTPQLMAELVECESTLSWERAFRNASIDRAARADGAPVMRTGRPPAQHQPTTLYRMLRAWNK